MVQNLNKPLSFFFCSLGLAEGWRLGETVPAPAFLVAGRAVGCPGSPVVGPPGLESAVSQILPVYPRKIR